MSHRKINAALSLHLSTLSYSIAYENAPFTPATGLYLSENYLPATTSEVGIETGSTDDYTGLYQINVHAPRDGYKFEAYTVADEVAATFSRGTVLANEDITVRVQRVSQSSPLNDGDRFVIPVTVDWRSLQRG